jgi:hypothetical protein
MGRILWRVLCSAAIAAFRFGRIPNDSQSEPISRGMMPFVQF